MSVMSMMLMIIMKVIEDDDDDNDNEDINDDSCLVNLGGTESILTMKAFIVFVHSSNFF